MASFISLCELLLKLIIPTATIAILLLLIIVFALLYSHNATVPKFRRRGTPVHLLIVLGSGGHTTEMIYMLNKSLNTFTYTYRTYVVTSGDPFSATKATEFEEGLIKRQPKTNKKIAQPKSYDVITIPRARRVHQSYWTAPFTTLQALWACLLVLCGRYPDQKKLPWKFPSPHPDLIITNGPAVSVCMVLAAKILRFWIFISRWVTGQGSKPEICRLRTIFVESWARITSLSTSGLLLLPLADRFLVQWPDLAGRRAWWGMKKTEHGGWMVL
ncbi:UDP-N-acetylglucosamine transferase subunit alg14 [Penicillium malachiteum]|nr:UDP-N-acetylglucosamine transferase subunit alg14 [Penicillium malachiteum]